MKNYTIRNVNINGVSQVLVFDFEPDDPDNELLSGFLVTDSRLVFGHRFENFNDIMKSDNYEAGGNVYDINISPENVTITLTVDVDNERSMSISRKEFTWVMNEWIRENLKQ